MSRVKKNKLFKNKRNQRLYKKNYQQDKKNELLTHLYKNNLLKAVFWQELTHAQDKAEELMDTFWKEKNSNFMSRRSNRKRNDNCNIILSIIQKVPIFHSLFEK